MSDLSLQLLPGRFAIHRLPASAQPPPELFTFTFVSITKTENELSIVCPAELFIAGAKVSDGWRCWQVVGVLDFSLTDILASLAGVLAEASIHLFALSTFDTDYILVPEAQLARTEKAFRQAGYHLQ